MSRHIVLPHGHLLGAIPRHGQHRLYPSPPHHRGPLRRPRGAPRHRRGDTTPGPGSHPHPRPRRGRRPDRPDGSIRRLHPSAQGPFTPGYEFVGEVVDHGDGAADYAPAPGTIVAAALPAMGAYTEYASVPTWLLIEVPAGMSPHTAASIPLDYLTATSLLDTHARVHTGDTVL